MKKGIGGQIGVQVKDTESQKGKTQEEKENTFHDRLFSFIENQHHGKRTYSVYRAFCLVGSNSSMGYITCFACKSLGFHPQNVWSPVHSKKKEHEHRARSSPQAL